MARSERRLREVVFGWDNEEYPATFVGPQLSVICVRVRVQEIARSHPAAARVQAAGQDIAFFGTRVLVRGKSSPRSNVEEKRRITCRTIEGEHFHPDTWHRVREPIAIGSKTERESCWDRRPGKAGQQTLSHLRPRRGAGGKAGKRQRQRLVEFDDVGPRIVSHYRTDTCESCWRNVSNPVRMRVLTVPSGSLCRSASSEWVSP